MGAFVLRRLVQAVLTVFGVMLVTFALFRVVSGDIAAAHLGERATEGVKADWRHLHGYDRPLFLNVHRRLVVADRTTGDNPLTVLDVGKGRTADNLALIPVEGKRDLRMGRYVFRLAEGTPVAELTGGKEIEPAGPSRGPGTAPATSSAPATASAPASSSAPATAPVPRAEVEFGLADGSKLVVDVLGVRTCAELIERVNGHPDNRDAKTARRRVELGISGLDNPFRSQFFDHLYRSMTFQSRSLTNNKKLTEIIAERAPKSLALTLPAMVLGWYAGLAVSCFVAYFRGRLIDKLGVFLAVLGMCVPFLAYMIYAQWFMFHVSPGHAYGLAHRVNIYVPVLIMVVAGLGGSVRFYRTVLLDQTNSDYVRTARAKGVSLPAVLFKHVLRNCMLPILTNLILAIPFLIMGSLLVETYFGIPGLGDLMLSSINGRNEPILSGLVFLTALIYTLGVLLTDLSYVVFDPRIRLQ